VNAKWLLSGLLACATACSGAAATPTPLLHEDLAGADGLIASEHQPAPPGGRWTMTSGSLFRVDSTGWSGRSDAGGYPGATGSAVFRMVSTDRSLQDVDIAVDLLIENLSETGRTPPQDYDGVHVWARYRSPMELYAMSVDRRDGALVIKKKCAGGTDNGGTYFDLTPLMPGAPIPFGQRQHVRVRVQDLSDGSVAMSADRDGHVFRAVDNGVGCAALTGPGAIGIRGDNAEFRLFDIVVDSASPQ
jgi:hypothetical protein